MLSLKSGMFMTPLHLTLDKFVGDEDQRNAPIWLQKLKRVKGKCATFVRHYLWLHTCVWTLLSTPRLQLPFKESWMRITRHVHDIKVRVLLSFLMH